MREKIKKILFGKLNCYFQILVFILVVLLFVMVYVFYIFDIIEIDWENIRKINWEAISAIALIITAIVILSQALATKNQALATKELADKTRMPNVNIGLKSRGEDKDKTNICIHNLSNFAIWIWLSIKFYRNKEEMELHKNEIPSTELKYGENYPPIPPNQAYELPVEKIRPYILERKDKEVIYAFIEYSCTIDSERPGPDIKSTIIRYGYGPEKEWWLYAWGMPFLCVHDLLRR